MVDAIHAGSTPAGALDAGVSSGASPPERRDDVLEAVAFAAERFLRAARWREVADEVLERLAAGTAASRAYIVENGIDDQGRLSSTRVAEWCADDVAPLIVDPEVATAPWTDSGFGRWADLLGGGETVVGPTRS